MSNPPSVQNSPQNVRRMVTIEVGQRLQLSREEQGLSLESISDAIKLSQAQLSALENGDWRGLPNETFALAFLRQYAQHLGINIETTVEQLKSVELNFHQPLTFPDPAIAPNRTWAIAAAALFVLLLVSWNLLGSKSKSPPNAPSPVAEIPQQPTIAPTITTTIKVENPPTPKQSPPVTKPIKPVTKVEPTVSISVAKTIAPPAVKAVTLDQPVVVKKTAPAIPAATTKKKTLPIKTPLPVGVTPHEFSFHAANERVWLLVEAPDGKGGRKRLREVIIRPRHSIEIVRKNPILFVSVGNAGGIKVTFEGKTLYNFGQLGPRGMVIRHHEIRGVPNKPIIDEATPKPSLQ